MSDNLPTLLEGHPAFSDAPDRPLGTAHWHQFGDGVVPSFQSGDLWLSRTIEGHSVGMHDKGHVFVCCQARSGKGTSIVIPNVLKWEGSLFVIDPKGEAAIVAARHRGRGSPWCEGKGQKVYILDPANVVRRDDDDFADLKACFNPLDMIDPFDPEAVDQAARIADSLIEPSGNDPFWSNAARDYLKIIILYVTVSPTIPDDERNLMTVRRLLQEGEASLRNHLAPDADGLPSPFEMLFEGMRRVGAYGGVVARAGNQYREQYEKSERTFFSIMSVALSNTEFLDSPGIQNVVRMTSFDLCELKTDPNGISIFLSLPQRQMATHSRWLRMMVTLGITEMERVKHQPKSGHQVLMVLDEFAGLRAMPAITDATAQIAGFGVKMMFVVQSLAQLQNVYPKDWQSYIANSQSKIFFNNDDNFTREYVSKLLGHHEVVRQTRSQSTTTGDSRTETKGTSITETDGVTFTVSRNVSTGYGPGGSTGGSSSGSSRADSYSTAYGKNVSFSFATNRSETQGTSEVIHKRALLNPDEVGWVFSQADNPLALILVTGMRPLALKRSHYFADDAFAECYDPHPDHPYPKTLIEKLRDYRQEEEEKEEQDLAWEALLAAADQMKYTPLKKPEPDPSPADHWLAAAITAGAVLLTSLPIAFFGYLILVDSWFPIWDMITSFPITSLWVLGVPDGGFVLGNTHHGRCVYRWSRRNNLRKPPRFIANHEKRGICRASFYPYRSSP